MEWFRWYHETASDPKLGVVARRAGQPKVAAVAIWVYLLEQASKADDRGSVASIDLELAAVALDLDVEVTTALFDAFVQKNMVVDGRVANWEKRQPNSDHTAAERAKRYRDGRKTKRDDSETVTSPSRDATVTHHDPSPLRHGKEEETETEKETELKNSTHTQNIGARACDFENDLKPPGVDDPMDDRLNEQELRLIGECVRYYQRHIAGDADWVEPYLTGQKARLKTFRPDMSLVDFSACWFDAVESGKRNNAQASKWFKSAFEGKLFDWKPQQKPKVSGQNLSSIRPQHEMILTAPMVRYGAKIGPLELERLQREGLPIPSYEGRGDGLEYVPAKHVGGEACFRVKSTGVELPAQFFQIVHEAERKETA
jgi:hypothetical protein